MLINVQQVNPIEKGETLEVLSLHILRWQRLNPPTFCKTIKIL
jgi:hypothetical protein